MSASPTSFFRDDTETLYVVSAHEHGATSKALFSPEELHDSRVERAGELLKMAAVQGDTVLDVGCGYGSLIPHVPAGVKYVGMDPNPAFLKKASEDYPSTLFIHSGIPLADNIPPPLCDYVVSLGVACHLMSGVASLVWYAHKLQLMARKGIIIEIQTPAYNGSFTKFSTEEIVQAFCQRIKAENTLSHPKDSASTYLFFL
jgi:SAM-dependent methyltransferase